MPTYPSTPQSGQLYWAQVPYLPESPLDVLRRMPGHQVRVALTFKTPPVLIVQNRHDNASPAYPFALIAAVHSIKPGELEKLRRINHPTDLLLSPAECGLRHPSVVFLNQLLTIHKNLLQECIGTVPPARVAELNVKLALALGLVDS